MLEVYVTSASCFAACRAITLASGLASSDYAYLQTPGASPPARSSLGQTFTTGAECVILSSFALGLLPPGGAGLVQITALLYPYDLTTDRVTGSRLASQSTSATQSQGSLTVTFPQPVQLSPATTYAIILTTAGLGQSATDLEIDFQRSLPGNPNPIPGGKWIYQSGLGDIPSAIEANPFLSASDNLGITIN